MVGKPGVAAARNFVIDDFNEGKHIVSFDDNVMEVAIGSKQGDPFPARGLQGIVAHADRLMKEQYAFIWGSHPSDNCLTQDQPNK